MRLRASVFTAVNHPSGSFISRASSEAHQLVCVPPNAGTTGRDNKDQVPFYVPPFDRHQCEAERILCPFLPRGSPARAAELQVTVYRGKQH